QAESPAAAAQSSWAGSIARAKATLGSQDWIALVPPGLKDALLSQILTAQTALLTDILSKGEPSNDVLTDMSGFLEKCAKDLKKQGLESALYRVLKDVPRRQRTTVLESFASRLAPGEGSAAVLAYWLAYATSPTPAKARKI